MTGSRPTGTGCGWRTSHSSRGAVDRGSSRRSDVDDLRLAALSDGVGATRRSSGRRLVTLTAEQRPAPSPTGGAEAGERARRQAEMVWTGAPTQTWDIALRLLKSGTAGLAVDTTETAWQVRSPGGLGRLSNCRGRTPPLGRSCSVGVRQHSCPVSSSLMARCPQVTSAVPAAMPIFVASSQLFSLISEHAEAFDDTSSLSGDVTMVAPKTGDGGSCAPRRPTGRAQWGTQCLAFDDARDLVSGELEQGRVPCNTAPLQTRSRPTRSRRCC